jgi:UMF1 family MFS transporter
MAFVSAAVNNPRVVRAWCMYDWANSVYSLVITSAIFPVYYKSVMRQEGTDLVRFLGYTLDSSVLYSYALSVSFLIVAIMLPLLSGVADYVGRKKWFMQFFVVLGSGACMALFFFRGPDDLAWAIGCSMLASIGFSASLVFYNAFLPEIASPDQFDRVSARGYSMGYYGSVLLMIVCLAMILNATAFGFANEGAASRFSFLLTGLWWFGFALIPFVVLKENGTVSQHTSVLSKGYRELAGVWQRIRHLPSLKRYLLAFFFFNMGVQTIMYLATLFGTDVLHLADDKLIGTILVIQLVGALGAGMFARLSGRQGNKRTLLIMIGIWILVCLVAYALQTEWQFYALAFVVGMIMGGIQSLSRATYAKLIPADTKDHASFFSFYDVTYNISIVLGTFSFGLINQITGSMRNSALGLGLFFVVGLFVLLTVKDNRLSARNG